MAASVCFSGRYECHVGGDAPWVRLTGYYALRGFCYSTTFGALDFRVGTRLARQRDYMAWGVRFCVCKHVVASWWGGARRG